MSSASESAAPRFKPPKEAETKSHGCAFFHANYLNKNNMIIVMFRYLDYIQKCHECVTAKIKESLIILNYAKKSSPLVRKKLFVSNF